METKVELQRFYPTELEVANIYQTDTEIRIKCLPALKAVLVPKCGTISEHPHGTYEEKVQDLPILGKSTWLLVNTYEYQCDNPDCDVTIFAGDYQWISELLQQDD